MLQLIPAKFYFVYYKFKNKILKTCLIPLFKSAGTNLEFSPVDSIFSYKSISIGDNVQVGSNAVIIASESEFK